jgi:DNA-binding NtrC family response regulator
MAAADFVDLGVANSARPVVLIVEDEVLIRMLLSEALRQAGYDVIEAADADEAIEVMHASVGPDILITDVKMPGSVDGFGLAAYVRRAKPGLKVIVTSGHAGPDGAVGVADAFLHKPYELGQILQQVRTLTEPL